MRSRTFEPAQRSDVARVATLRRGVEEGRLRGPIGMGVEERVAVEASYLGRREVEIVRTLERLVAHPPANGERLGESFPPGNPDGGGRRGADSERCDFAGSPVHDSQHGWDPEEHAQIDSRVA